MTIAFVSSACFRTVLRGHLNIGRRDNAAGAVQNVDLVLLEQEGDAVDVGLHRRVLVRHHRGEIELRRSDLHAELAARPCPASSNISEA